LPGTLKKSSYIIDRTAVEQAVMLEPSPTIPVVMTFSSNDPSGGCGIQADIETTFSLGCHCAAVITAITVQDTNEIKDYSPTPASLVIAQARAVLEDMPIAAFKIGCLGSVENATAIHTILTDYPHIPVVFNPLASAAGMKKKVDSKLIAAITTLLCPLTTILTPDNISAQVLVPNADTLEACGKQLIALGSKYVLITGTHTSAPNINNLFFNAQGLQEIFTWERLPQQFHGCSCTFSAGIASLLALGHSPETAIRDAQLYTFESLKQGFRLGMGKPLPDRRTWWQKK
jgi:hydroxymethylpyrimidine/phosphomethylpyrimidine kinase